MEPIALSVKNISKKFRLFNSPKERFLEAFHPFNKKYHKEFWALRNVSLDVPKGKTLGIIGRNGSGKSTLLKILCSILKPTSGTVGVNGRISALLELGSGFNPEFTGRQNILLKGMLMGFSQKEMRNRLPEIEAFADIGGFIDQPMKIYSSGMAVRLAFACAINVDPDILIVDEAIAVGDAKFQHKCYCKFLDFQKVGKTIVVVTHDASALIKRCDSAIFLERGEIAGIGKTKEICDRYLDFLFTGKIPDSISSSVLEEDTRGFSGGRRSPSDRDPSGHSIEGKHTPYHESDFDKFLSENPLSDQCARRSSYNKNENRLGDKRAVIIDYFVCTPARVDTASLRSGEIAHIFLKAKFYEELKSLMVGFSIKTIDGIVVYGSNTRFAEIPIAPFSTGAIGIFEFSIKLDLFPGDYFIDLGIAEKIPTTDSPIDIRRGLIHLVVSSKEHLFLGFVDLCATFEEVSRFNLSSGA